MISLKGRQSLIKKQANVTGNTMKQSVSGGGGGPVLLQEEEENVAEDANNDAAVNAEANKVDDNKKDVVVTIEEEKKNLEYPAISIVGHWIFDSNYRKDIFLHKNCCV